MTCMLTLSLKAVYMHLSYDEDPLLLPVELIVLLYFARKEHRL